MPARRRFQVRRQHWRRRQCRLPASRRSTESPQPGNSPSVQGTPLFRTSPAGLDFRFGAGSLGGSLESSREQYRRGGGALGRSPNDGKFECYLPRVLLRRLVAAPRHAVLSLDGTAVFVDISGFTRLSERVARRGNEGAEVLVDTINACFSTLLPDAYANGASVLKFSGDALLLWFEGERHAARACSSAFAMRRALRRAPPGTFEARLRMSTGVHSGSYEMFLVGGSHREHLIAGPAASALVAMEAAAAPGQILLSDATAALLAPACLGSTCGPGILLARDPPSVGWKAPEEPLAPADDAIAACLSTALRAHVRSGLVHPEHRTATVAFLRFGKLDELIAGEGAERAAEQVDELVRVVQDGADRYEICILGSDIAIDGATLLLSAGAPRAVGDDEERMLLALRHVADANPRLAVRVGVNRGQRVHRRGRACAPAHLRGDGRHDQPCRAAGGEGAVGIDLCHAQRRSALAHAVSDDRGRHRSRSRARSVRSSRSRSARLNGPPQPDQARTRLPLVGRDRELACAAGRGQQRDGMDRARLIELVGETGSGKSRLLSEARTLAGEMRFIHSTCEAYTREIPYSAWREPLRHVLGVEWDESELRCARPASRRPATIAARPPAVATAAGDCVRRDRSVEHRGRRACARSLAPRSCMRWCSASSAARWSCPRSFSSSTRT